MEEDANVSRSFFYHGELLTNAFYFTFSDHEKVVYKYSVDFSPEISRDNKRLRKRIFNSITEKIKQDYGVVIYQGDEQFYSWELVHAKNSYKTESELFFWQQEFEVTTKLILNLWTYAEHTHFKNILLRRLLSWLKLSQIGKKYYNWRKIEELNFGELKVIHGYTWWIKDWFVDFLLHVNTSHLFVRSESALDVITNYGSDPDKIKCHLVGKTVLTSYNENRVFQVKSVQFDMSPRSKFKWFDKTTEKYSEISFEEYYKQRYGIQIEDLSQPMLRHFDKQTKKTIYLVPELCKMTGLSDSQNKDFRLKKHIQRKTIGSGIQFFKAIGDLFDMIKENEKWWEFSKDWSLDTNFKQIWTHTEQLASANFVFSKDEDEKKAISTLSKQEEIDKHLMKNMYSNAKFSEWAILYSEGFEKEKDLFVENIMKNARSCSFMIDWRPHEIKVKKGRSWREALFKLKYRLSRRPDIVIWLIKTEGEEDTSYNEVKWAAIWELQINTQFVKIETILSAKSLTKICSRILIQINAKIGGIPWTISDIPLWNEITAVMGISVWKNSNCSLKSITSVSISTNKGFSRYASFWVEQPNGTESANVGVWLEKALDAFQKNNHNLSPTNLIIYRDGIWRSQIEMIFATEVACLKEKCREAGIALAYILVNKNTPIRWFHESKKSKLEHLRPGTIIDCSITPRDLYLQNNYWLNFYLFSRNSKTDRSRWSYFNLLHCSPRINFVLLEKLSYRLWYLYFNNSRGVKVPAPLKYANKLAEMVGKVINFDVNDNSVEDKDERTPVYWLPGKKLSTRTQLYFI
jgi:aubergine